MKNLFDQLDPDYPRPQMVRENWISLNGTWSFSYDDLDIGLVEGWKDRSDLGRDITVPFPYQSSRSGIGEKEVHEIIWYAREFTIPEAWVMDSLMLHFCAVDYRTTVWLNGQLVGDSEGGHVPFSFDIAALIIPGQNRINLRVEDRQDPCQPRGKQSSSGKPVRIYYYCTSGIWQTVWLEPLPRTRIAAFTTTSSALDGTIRVQATIAECTGEATLKMRVFPDLHSSDPIHEATAEVVDGAAQLCIALPDPACWSPGSPHLYRYSLLLYRSGVLDDAVQSYTGVRTFGANNQKFYLNGQEIFLLMVLDQGYWPDTLMATSSRKDFETDISFIKQFGFNAVRKHQKIEDERWLFCCDLYGLLVWEEMPNARSWSPAAETRLLGEWERAIRRDMNHPCVVTWVPIVESLGFPELARVRSNQIEFLEKIVQHTKLLDPTRLVNDNDGWEHTQSTDICSIHDYTQPIEKFCARYADARLTGIPPAKGWYKDKPLFLFDGAYAGQPIVLSEIGGFLRTAAEAGSTRRDRLFDYYGNVDSEDALLVRYRELMQAVSAFDFLAGVCYTQLTDIEHETNGLLTYDRRPKLDVDAIRELHRSLFTRKIDI